MSEPNLISDLDKTLIQFIQQNVSELSSATGIELKSPGEMQSVTDTKLSLFLYKVMDDPHVSGDFSKANGVKKWPPTVVNLFYMMTPYASAVSTERHIIQKLMRSFQDYARLEESILQGELVATGNDAINVHRLIQTDDFIHQMWSGFPDTQRRLSLFYQLRRLIIPSLREEPAAPVITEKDIDIHGKED